MLVNLNQAGLEMLDHMAKKKEKEKRSPTWQR